jgi:hypothetical protein
LKLRRIGEGLWQADGSSKRIRTEEPGLELWRTKITKGGRIIWQVGQVVVVNNCSGSRTGTLNMGHVSEALHLIGSWLWKLIRTCEALLKLN